MKSNNQIKIDDLRIDLSTLKSKEELIAQFEENGATHSSLMDFCEEYLERYHNELCWNYPITDELHLGMFFVLVSEGVFCIPYDEVDDMEYEIFCIEDAKMLDVDSLDNFISDWYRYDRDLKNAMYAMQTYLHRRENMSSKIDWVIHYCTNGVCDGCGKTESDFLPYACNAHTHGMDKYGHMDFQIVLALSPEEVCRILNTLGQRVQAGERFRAGDYVSGIYLDCDIRLDEYEETGRQVLRIVIPDRNNRYPEHPACMPPYPLQLLKTDNLYWKGDSGTCS